MPKNTSFFIPSAEKPLTSSHTPHPSASALERVMKTIWNALRDMLNMDHAVRRRGPDGQTHQAREEQRGEAHDTENHFPLGNEMHEVSRHREGLPGGGLLHASHFRAENDFLCHGLHRVVLRGPDGFDHLVHVAEQHDPYSTCPLKRSISSSSPSPARWHWGAACGCWSVAFPPTG